MTDRHFLQIQGRPFPAGQCFHVEVDGPVSLIAQALADETGVPVHACLNIGGSYWPDERVGDWGSFLPRR